MASDKSQYLTEGTTVCETVYEHLKFDVSRPKCIVIEESWPSWLTVVLSQQFEPMCIYSGDFCNVKNYFPVKYRKAWKSVIRFSVKQLNTVDVVFVSGSLHFLIKFNKLKFNASKIVVLEGVQPHRRTLRHLDNYSWERIRHSSCGGVTNSQFWYGWTDERMLSHDETLPKRYIWHIISSSSKTFQKEADPHTDPYASFGKVQNVGDGIVSSAGLLPITNLNSKVLCPSVFTKMGWCIRKLRVKELAESFDQPMSISEFCHENKVSSYRAPFSKGVPNKVTSYILRRLGFVQSVRIAHTNDGLNSPLPVITVPPTIEAKHLKAVKSDDTAVDTFIWDERVLSLFPHIKYQRETVDKLNGLRRFFLRAWFKRVWKSFFYYLEEEYSNDWIRTDDKSKEGSELRLDILQFTDCAYRAKSSSWFEWGGGSTLFFWRWPPEIRKMARDGIPYWFNNKRPKAKVAQSFERNQTIREKVKEKLSNVRSKGYITSGFVKSLIKYFSVPKGENGVRMVYDGTSSGFNDFVWAPSFGLPTIDSMLRSVDHDTWLGDIDVGEQFLNFQLCKEAQLYCGVDLTPYFGEEVKDGKTKVWERWTRCLMGAKASPYQAIRFMLWAEHLVRGNRLDSSNPFRWSYIHLNLSGSGSYDPSLPWVAKRRSEGSLASEFYIYVDDVRMIGPSEEEIWKAIRRFSSIISYLGIQDAARKRRPPTTRPGAWAGSMVYIDQNHIGVYIDQTKWDKTRLHIAWIKEELLKCDNITNMKLPKHYGIDRKELERKRGFLVYISRTYPAMTPYLKGIHHTLDGWREGRDEDGWRIPLSEMRAVKNFKQDLNYIYPKDAPKTVLPSPRLEEDILCLERLFEGKHPVVRHVRTKLVLVAYYGFDDASGTGFGSSFQGRDGLRIRHGLWGKDSNKLSSNYRELCNLVGSLELEVDNGTIIGSEVFVFTDNSVAEACYYKGTSSSRSLFNLVLRLRRVELRGGIKINLIHVSGKRMIAQGSDGLSRGNLLEGVMAGENMLNFVPLHLTAIDRSTSLLKWLKSWSPNKTLRLLRPEDWYDVGHGIIGGRKNNEGIWTPEYDTTCELWCPAPAAAFHAMEELSRARHVDLYTPRLFVCARLMTFGWRKLLLKYADVVFYINAGSREFWPSQMYEPLVIGLVLPFSRHPPWQLKRSPQVLEMEGKLSEVWSDPKRDERSVLCQFWTL